MNEPMNYANPQAGMWVYVDDSHIKRAEGMESAARYLDNVVTAQVEMARLHDLDSKNPAPNLDSLQRAILTYHSANIRELARRERFLLDRTSPEQPTPTSPTPEPPTEKKTCSE